MIFENAQVGGTTMEASKCAIINDFHRDLQLWPGHPSRACTRDQLSGLVQAGCPEVVAMSLLMTIQLTVAVLIVLGSARGRPLVPSQLGCRWVPASETRGAHDDIQDRETTGAKRLEISRDVAEWPAVQCHPALSSCRADANDLFR